MFIITLLFNFLFVLIQSRRRYRAAGRAAGMGKITKTFGNGVASLIKDIKQGNWGEEEYPEFDQKKDIRPLSGRNINSMEPGISQYMLIVIAVIVATVLIICIVNKFFPQTEERSVVEDMKRRNNERYKHYQAVKMIAETGVHPDKAFGRLQRITYKQKKK